MDWISSSGDVGIFFTQYFSDSESHIWTAINFQTCGTSFPKAAFSTNLYVFVTWAYDHLFTLIIAGDELLTLM